MNSSDSIRVFVGCAANNEDLESQSVLEWSIRKHATQPVDMEWMRLSRDPASPYAGWDTAQWATPFSGFRWAVPALCGFEGRAIYMDSDIIVMADIAELWKQPMAPGKAVLAKGAAAAWRYCVSVWDCAAAERWALPLETLRSDPGSHRTMTGVYKRNPKIVQPFEGDWNCLDGEKRRNLTGIKAIHYTDMSTQPQLRHALPRLAKAGTPHWYDGPIRTHWRADILDLFDKLLAEATEHGYGIERYVVEPYGPYRKAALRSYPGRKAMTIK